MEILVLLIVACALAVLGLVLFLVWNPKEPETVAAPPEPSEKSSQLARLVWAAHVSVQDHNEAVLMGSADQVAFSLMNVIYTTNNLESYLRKQKEKADDNV